MLTSLAIAEACVRASEGVEVHGPVEQGPFLESMGIEQRAEVLRKAAAATAGGEAKAVDIEKAWRRLVDRGPEGMGKLYKVLAILPENEEEAAGRFWRRCHGIDEIPSGLLRVS